MSGLFSNNQDIFATQADTRFNSFSDPMNSVNQNRGNGQWGINSNYLTPSYTSPFRPQYQGPSGNSYQGANPGFWSSANQIFNPFAPGGTNYGGNYINQQSPFFDSIGQKPMDTAGSFMQNWAVPTAAAWGAYKYLGGAGRSIGGQMGEGFARGMFANAGMNASQMGGVMAAGRGLGGFLGSTILPGMAAQAAVSMFDYSVMDPWIAQRQMGRSLRDNFRGVTFNEGGSPLSGGGLSRSMAQRIAGSVSAAGTQDMTFNQKETALLTDLSGRSGLMDNANSSQLAQRFANVLKQVKVVMSVANTSDFRETIEIMSKMQSAGLGGVGLSGNLGRMSALASQSGQSMQKLMNTVGAQGQYMFGAAGLTPYIGQNFAFGASASFGAAFRNGLLSPAMMARMGGVEGATQSAVAGAASMYQTPYAGMIASNAYMGGGAGNGVISNVAKFGGRLTGDPLENMGLENLRRNSNTSAFARDKGLMGQIDMISDVAKVMGKNGKIGAGAAFQILTQQLGLPPDQAQAVLAQINSYQNEGTVHNMLAATGRTNVDLVANYSAQEGLNKGIFTTPYNAVKRFGKGFQSIGGQLVDDGMEAGGRIMDKMEEWFIGGLSNINKKTMGTTFESLENLNVATQAFNLSGAEAKKLGMTGVGKNMSIELAKINKAAEEGDSDAQEFIKTKGQSGKDRNNLIIKLARKGIINKDYQRSETHGSFINAADTVGVVDIKGAPVKTAGSVLQDAFDQLGEGTVENKLGLLNLLGDMDKTYAKGDLASDAQLNSIKVLTGKDMDYNEARKWYESFSGKVGKAGLGHLVGKNLNKIMGSKDGATVNDVANFERENFLDVLMPSIGESNTGASVETRQALAGVADERARILQLSKQNKIGVSETFAAINNVDNGITVGAFSEAVGLFGEYVGKLADTKGIKSTPGQASLVLAARNKRN